jgi:hypothetical protein
MKAFGLTLRIAGATLLLLALQAFWDHVWLAARFKSSQGPPVLSSLLVVLALALVAASSKHRGWKLSGTLFVLYFGINRLNTLDEALLFKIGLRTHEILRLLGAGFCTALPFTPLLALLLGCWSKSGEEELKPLEPRSAAGWAERIVLGIFLYVLCYFIAGVAAYPFAKDFYAGFTLPDTASILSMEIFRGLVYVAAGLVVVNGMKGQRGRAAATLGLAFPILAGVAPLLMHNPYLPDYVRLAHAFEIGTSNLAFGALLGHILTRKAATPTDVQQAGSARFIL